MLRSARKRAGFSQQELANLAGLDRVTIGRIERGTHTPRFSTLTRIANALQIDISHLGASWVEEDDGVFWRVFYPVPGSSVTRCEPYYGEVVDGEDD